jgi:hypothetical protein
LAGAFLCQDIARWKKGRIGMVVNVAGSREGAQLGPGQAGANGSVKIVRVLRFRYIIGGEGGDELNRLLGVMKDVDGHVYDGLSDIRYRAHRCPGTTAITGVLHHVVLDVVWPGPSVRTSHTFAELSGSMRKSAFAGSDPSD